MMSQIAIKSIVNISWTPRYNCNFNYPNNMSWETLCNSLVINPLKWVNVKTDLSQLNLGAKGKNYVWKSKHFDHGPLVDKSGFEFHKHFWILKDLYFTPRIQNKTKFSWSKTIRHTWKQECNQTLQSERRQKLTTTYKIDVNNIYLN